MDGRGVVWVYVEVELKILQRWQKVENESWVDSMMRGNFEEFFADITRSNFDFQD